MGHRGFVWDQRMVPLGIFNVYVLLGGLVVWKIWDFLMKGIFFVKGGTLIRIPNDRDPNHQFSISWFNPVWKIIKSNWIISPNKGLKIKKSLKTTRSKLRKDHPAVEGESSWWRWIIAAFPMMETGVDIGAPNFKMAEMHQAVSKMWRTKVIFWLEMGKRCTWCQPQNFDQIEGNQVPS